MKYVKIDDNLWINQLGYLKYKNTSGTMIVRKNIKSIEYNGEQILIKDLLKILFK